MHSRLECVRVVRSNGTALKDCNEATAQAQPNKHPVGVLIYYEPRLQLVAAIPICLEAGRGTVLPLSVKRTAWPVGMVTRLCGLSATSSPT